MTFLIRVVPTTLATTRHGWILKLWLTYSKNSTVAWNVEKEILSRVSRFRFVGNALYDMSSRKVSTNSRISTITEYSFQLRVCLPLLYAVFPLEYFLYPFYTGQQFYKLVSQSILWLQMSSAKNKCGNTMWVSRVMFTCEMFQACNHSFFISPLGMGFGHQNCVFVGCPNSGKRLNKWPKQTCSCMFKRDNYLRLWATI